MINMRLINKNNKKASSTVEYATMFLFVVLALTTFFFFFKSAVAGKWKSGFDVFGFGRQFDAKNSTVTSPFIK